MHDRDVEGLFRWSDERPMVYAGWYVKLKLLNMLCFFKMIIKRACDKARNISFIGLTQHQLRPASQMGESLKIVL